jgi:hypothetical protein
MMRLDKSLVVFASIDNVCGEQATEEHKLGHKENPHADGISLSLLVEIFELMRD